MATRKRVLIQIFWNTTLTRLQEEIQEFFDAKLANDYNQLLNISFTENSLPEGKTIYTAYIIYEVSVFSQQITEAAKALIKECSKG
jgi:hypothetical protein